MKIKIFLGLAIIALISLAGCDINPSDASMKPDVSIQSEEELLSRGYSLYTRYAWYWTPGILSGKIKNINPSAPIFIRLQIADSMNGPWGPPPGTDSTYKLLYPNQSVLWCFYSQCAKFQIYATSSSHFAYWFTYDF